MANSGDHFQPEEDHRSGFLAGMLAGAVLGAGLAMLFAPKSGAELRGRIAEHTGHLMHRASEGSPRAPKTDAVQSRDVSESADAPEPFNHPILVVVDPARSDRRAASTSGA